MNFSFRVDASSEVGFGHLMRSRTLAESFIRHGHSCTFIVAHSEQYARVGHCLKIFEIIFIEPSDEMHDSSLCLKIIENNKFDWMVIDNYHLGLEWERKIRKSIPVFVIEDHPNRTHECDILLDQSFFRKESEYLGRVPENCQLLLGKKYLLLRREFEVLRQRVDIKEKSKLFNKILLSLGGVDSKNITSKMITFLNELPELLSIKIVMNSKSPFLDEVNALVKDSKQNCSIVTDVDNMHELMCEADLAIGAGGISIWERCILGLPSITVTLAENQRALATELHELGIHESLGDYRDLSRQDFLKSWNFLRNERNWQEMSRLASNFIKESGTDKVCHFLTQ